MFNRFVNETDITQSIVALAKLKSYGYEYANLDGAWMLPTRNPITHRQQPSAAFPNGIKPLADLAHSHGIKFGSYTSVGNITCQGNPGSWGYEQIDAEHYAEIGLDYLKIDSCGGTPNLGPNVDVQRNGFERMRDALNSTGRPVYINTCGMYGVSKEQEQNRTSSCTAPNTVGGAAYTNDVDGWRNESHLIANSWLIEWENNLNSFFQAPCGRGWLTILDANEDLTNSKWVGPGGWNDMDILSVGCSNAEKETGTPHTDTVGEYCPGCKHTDCNNGNQTIVEQQSQFALWCMKSAPLILGGDLRALSPEILAIVTNKEMIAIDQDVLGIPAQIVFQTGGSNSGGVRNLLEARPCNSSDPYQQWKGAIFTDTKTATSTIVNGASSQCLATTWNDPVTISACDVNSTLFVANVVNVANVGNTDNADNTKSSNAITIEIVKSPGDGGYQGRCLDLNHGIGPDVDLWECHVPSHPDYQHQLFEYSQGRITVPNRAQGETEEQCLGLYSSIAPLRTLTIFTKILSNATAPRAIALFNRGDVAAKMLVKKEHLLLHGNVDTGDYEVSSSCSKIGFRDIVKHEVVASDISIGTENMYSVVVESHQTVVLLVECEVHVQLNAN